jgi:hypothetical protein
MKTLTPAPIYSANFADGTGITISFQQPVDKRRARP